MYLNKIECDELSKLLTVEEKQKLYLNDSTGSAGFFGSAVEEKQKLYLNDSHPKYPLTKALGWRETKVVFKCRGEKLEEILESVEEKQKLYLNKPMYLTSLLSIYGWRETKVVFKC